METADLSGCVILVTGGLFCAAGSYLWLGQLQLIQSALSTYSYFQLMRFLLLVESTAISLLAPCVIEMNPFYYLGSPGHWVLIPLTLEVSHYFLFHQHISLLQLIVSVPVSLMEFSGWIKIFWSFRWVCDRVFLLSSQMWKHLLLYLLSH